MLPSRCFVTVIVIFFTVMEAVSGEQLYKAAGDEVSFGPAKMVPTANSITWKHKSITNDVVKAIEWDEGRIYILNPKFQNVTSLDKTTGYITIHKLGLVHSGEYSIEIDSKEQDQKFILTVKERVPKPKITIEKSSNPDVVVYLKCAYKETVIWRNSTGEIPSNSPIGDSLTVKKSGNPDNFFTCTLDNGVSRETSDRVSEKDLFGDESSGPWWIVFPVIVILIVGGIVGFWLHKRKLFPCRKQYAPANTNGDSKENPAPSPVRMSNTGKSAEEGNQTEQEDNLNINQPDFNPNQS